MSNQLFLDFLIRKKILTKVQADSCLQKSIEEKKALATLLIQQGFLDTLSLKKQMEAFQQFTLSLPPETRAEMLAEPNLNILEEILQIPSDSVQGKTMLQSNTLRENTDLQQESISSQTKTNSPSVFKNASAENFERYQVLEVLGEGGMGVVERVKDQILKREVALKRIKLPSGSTQRLAKAQRILLWRFRREASITAILEHPNIIPLHDMEEKASGELFFTMCKVEGETLTKKFRKKRDKKESMEEHTILSIYMKVCDAISYAHSRGVIHRDLKPDNIMIGKFGEVYVMDWGIAKLVHETINENETSSTTDSFNTEGMKTIGGMGTPGYMAPEQAENAAQITLQADIHALGKILRECYTLLSPYEELMQRHQTERALTKIKKASQKKKRNAQEEIIPSDIVAIIDKATKDSPDERYESVQALAKDIEDYLHHREVSAKEYTFWELLAKWITRNRQKILIAGVLLLSCVAFASYLQIEKQRQQKKKIQNLMQQSKASLKKADQISQKDFDSQGLQIGYLFESFNDLNTLLEIQETSEVFNKEKFEVGKKLMSLALEREEYELAEYIEQNIQQTKHISDELKISFRKIRADSTLGKHLKQFEDYVEELQSQEFAKLKPIPQEERRKEIIFEIAKMSEEEIFEKLVQYLEESALYLEQNGAVSLEKIKFYQTLIQALGRLENSKVEKQLQDALEKSVRTKIAPNPFKDLSEDKDLAEVNYAVALADAVADLKDISYLETFEKLRNTVHPESLFFKKTERAYVKFLSMLSLSTEVLPDAESHLKRGKIRVKRKEFKYAMEDYNKALELNPRFAEAYNARGELYADITYFEGTDQQAAIHDFSEAIRLNPNFPEPYLSRGKIKKSFVSITSKDPKKNEEFSQEALQDFNSVIQIDPNHQQARLLLATFFFGKQEYSSSFENVNRVLKINPQSIDAYLTRAWIRYIRKFDGDIKSAIEDILIILRLSPQDYNALLQLGSLYVLIPSKVKEAIECYDQAILIDPYHKQAFSSRSWAKRGMKDTEGALADLNQAYFLDPSAGIDHYSFALLEIESNHPKEALFHLDKCVEAGSTYAFVYLNRGRLLYYYKKDTQKARADFIKFLEWTKGDQSPVIIQFRENLIKEFPALSVYR